MSSDGRGASNFLKNLVSQPKRVAFSRFSDQAVPIRTIFGVNLLPVSAEEGFNETPPLDLGLSFAMSVSLCFGFHWYYYQQNLGVPTWYFIRREESMSKAEARGKLNQSRGYRIE